MDIKTGHPRTAKSFVALKGRYRIPGATAPGKHGEKNGNAVSIATRDVESRHTHQQRKIEKLPLNPQRSQRNYHCIWTDRLWKNHTGPAAAKDNGDQHCDEDPIGMSSEEHSTIQLSEA